MSGDDTTYIRSSSLSGYPDCPRRAAARIFRKEVLAAGYDLRSDGARSIGATVGTAVHGAASSMYEEKAKTGELPSISVCEDFAAEMVKIGAAEGEVIYDRETPQISDAQKQAARMARLYRVTLAPAITPLLFEKRLEAEIAPGVVLTGQPDQVARENDALVDLKTGKSLGNHNPQVGSYALLARSHQMKIETARIDYVPRASLKNPQPPAQRLNIDVATAEVAASNILRHIQNDLAVFRSGDPAGHVLAGDPWAFAANPASKLCSDRWCPAWGTSFCHEWKGEPEVVA